MSAVACQGKIFVHVNKPIVWEYVMYCRNCGELWIADQVQKSIGPPFCQLCLYQPADGTMPYADMPEPQCSIVLAAFKLGGWEAVEGLGLPELLVWNRGGYTSVKWQPALDGDDPAPGTFLYGASGPMVPHKDKK